jgi:hypothetical protein
VSFTPSLSGLRPTWGLTHYVDLLEKYESVQSLLLNLEEETRRYDTSSFCLSFKVSRVFISVRQV